MSQYMLAMYYPDGPPPPEVDLQRVMSDLGKINDDIRAAGQWVFGNGLHDSTSATVVKASGDEMLATDGPYLEGKEHLGGFNVVDVPDLDAALEWARRISEVTGLPIEVRPFQG